MRFRYTESVKYTVWENVHFVVEAESQEEADRIVREKMRNSFAEDNFEVVRSGIDKDTIDFLPIEENGNQATVTVERKEGEDKIEVYNNEND